MITSRQLIWAYFLRLLSIQLISNGVATSEEWTIIDTKMMSKDLSMFIGYNPSGDSNAVYLLGGRNNPNSRYLFQIDSETFSFLGDDLSSPIYGWGGFSGSNGLAVIGDVIYFASADYDRSVFNSFQMSPSNTQVKASFDKPYETGYECFASDGEDHVFILGGRGPTMSNGEVDYFQIYKVSTNSWKTGPRLNWKYGQMACEVSSVTQRIYTFGGYNRYDASAPDRRMKDKIQSIGLDLAIFSKTSQSFLYIFPTLLYTAPSEFLPSF